MYPLTPAAGYHATEGIRHPRAWLHEDSICNATGAHNLLRDKIVKTGNDNAIPCSHEPKGYQAYTCSKCGTYINGLDVDQRVRAHDRACSSKLYRSDVDGYMVPKCNLHHESRSKMAKVRFPWTSRLRTCCANRT